MLKSRLGTDILNQTLPNDFKLLIDSYQTGDMDKWWNPLNEN